MVTWLGFRPMFGVIGFALLIFSSIAIYFIWQNRERLALTALAAAMVPIGFSMLDGVARMAPYFSLADAARFLDAQMLGGDKVFYEGPLHVGSSLIFYLDRKFYLLNQDLASEPGATREADRALFVDESALLTAWGSDDHVYLIVEKNRIPYWQKFFAKVRPQNQLMTCGTYAVLSNLP